MISAAFAICIYKKLFHLNRSCRGNSSISLCAIFADEVVTSHGPIEVDKENIRQEPYSLPQGFMWDTLDLSNADVVSTVFVKQSFYFAEVMHKMK